MAIESTEPVTEPAKVYDKWWLDLSNSRTIRRTEPTQSVALQVVWRLYRIAEDGTYDFHPTKVARTIIDDVYALAATRPSAGIVLEAYINELRDIAIERGDIK